MKVLVLGNYRQTITVVRSLARAGHTVVLGTSRVPPFTRFSNCVDEVWQHSEEVYEKSFQVELESYVRAEAKLNPIVVFPVGEAQLKAVSNLPVQAQALAAWAMPPAEIVRGCLDRAKANAIAARVGVPVPPIRQVNTKAAVLDAARELGFPLLCRLKDSTRSLGGRKAVMCWGPDDLSQVIGTPELAEGLHVLLHKRISGHHVNCHFSAYDGRVGAYFQQKILRMSGSDEYGDAVDSVSEEPDPAIRAQLEAIAGAFHYTGVGCARFLVEEGTRRAWFLELVPRLDLTCALPYLCGVDLPKLGVELATRGPGNEPLTPYPAGVRLRRLTWDWRDPVPTLYLYLVAIPIATLAALWRRLAARSARPADPVSQGSATGLPDRRGPSDPTGPLP